MIKIMVSLSINAFFCKKVVLFDCENWAHGFYIHTIMIVITKVILITSINIIYIVKN
jgi:hypothetical protein